jgi:hypothetical protein
MLEPILRRLTEPRIDDVPAPPRTVVVTYMTLAGLGTCALRNPRWCYREGRLAFVGEHPRGLEIGFDFEQILTLATAGTP